MSSTGVRESNSTEKRVIKGLILNEAQFIQSLRVFANTSTLSGLGATGTETNNSPLDASGNYLAKSGDIMLGQFGNAFDTIGATNIVSDILDVSKSTGTTFPVVILQGESPPAADDLVTITQGEDVFPFQELVIRTRSSIITIKNSDNINTPDGNDLVLPVGSIIHLYFDTFLGQWVIDGGTPFFGSGGISFPILYPQDDFGDQGLITLDVIISGNTGQNKKVRMIDDLAFGFSMPPGATVLEEIWFTFEQDGVGGHSIIGTPTGLKNAGQLDVLLDKTPNAKTTFCFITEDGGVTFRGKLIDLTSGGEFFGPWTATHDAGSQILDKLHRVNFTDIFGGVGGSIFGLGTSGLIVDDTRIVNFNDDSGTSVGRIIGSLTGLEIDYNEDIKFMTAVGNITRFIIGDVEHDSFLDIKMNNNNISDINQVQITGSSGDIVHGFLSGSTGLLNISAEENDSMIRMIATDGAIPKTVVEFNYDLGIPTMTFPTLGILDNVALISFGIVNQAVISRIGDDLSYSVTGINVHKFNGDVTFDDDLILNNPGSLIDMNGGTLFNFGLLLAENASAEIKMGGGTVQMEGGVLSLDVLQNQSIIALALANNYVVPVGGAHDFFVNSLIIPKFGITETSIESNVELNMNENNIIAGGAGEGITNIGHLDFIDNLATPVAAVAFYSDGTDMLVNTGGGVVNLSDVGDGIFLDSTFRVIGSGDQTKQLAFEVDTFTTATTRTFGWPDANGTVFITPAQEDLDLNTFDIFDIDKLAFMNFASTGSSLNIGFSALGSGGFRANVLNNGDFEITEENILHFSFIGSNNSINIVDSLFNVLETVGSTAYQISKFNGETILNEPTKIQQQIAGTDIFDIQSGGITMADNKSISNVDQIGFRILGNFIEDDGSGMRYISVPGDQHLFGDGTSIFATLDVDGLFLNQLFVQFTSIVSPGTTGSSNVGELFMDTNNDDHLSIIRNGGIIDLEGGGEINTASNVGGFAQVFKQKTGVDLEFRTLIGGTDIQIVQVADTLTFNFNGTSGIDGNGMQDGTPFVDPTSGNPLVDSDVYMSNSKQGLEISNTTTAVEDVMVYMPIYIGRTTNVDRLAWVKTGLGGGSVSWTMGIYDSVNVSPNVGANYPGDLIVSGNTTSTSAEGTKFIGISPTDLSPGLYWLGFLITNLTSGSLIDVGRHETANANCVGYYISSDANDRMDNILGFSEAETSIPSSAPAEMAILGADPMALFYRVNNVS